jgi:hypothetical protein
LKCRAVAAATSALGLEMSGLRKRNWRFRLDRSIVSRSIWEVSEVRGQRTEGAMETETPGCAAAKWCY